MGLIAAKVLLFWGLFCLTLKSHWLFLLAFTSLKEILRNIQEITIIFDCKFCVQKALMYAFVFAGIYPRKTNWNLGEHDNFVEVKVWKSGLSWKNAFSLSYLTLSPPTVQSNSLTRVSTNCLAPFAGCTRQRFFKNLLLHDSCIIQGLEHYRTHRPVDPYHWQSTSVWWHRLNLASH